MDQSEWPQWCNICDTKLTAPAVAQSHYAGKKHRETVEKLKNANTWDQVYDHDDHDDNQSNRCE